MRPKIPPSVTQTLITRKAPHLSRPPAQRVTTQLPHGVSVSVTNSRLSQGATELAPESSADSVAPMRIRERPPKPSRRVTRKGRGGSPGGASQLPKVEDSPTQSSE